MSAFKQDQDVEASSALPNTLAGVSTATPSRRESASPWRRERVCSLRRARLARNCSAKRSSRVFVELRSAGILITSFSGDHHSGSLLCSKAGCMIHKPRLRSKKSYGRSQPHSSASCGSSVVEHSLGKGEVESSILSRSTIFPWHYKGGSLGYSLFPSEQTTKLPLVSPTNQGKIRGCCLLSVLRMTSVPFCEALLLGIRLSNENRACADRAARHLRFEALL